MVPRHGALTFDGGLRLVSLDVRASTFVTKLCPKPGPGAARPGMTRSERAKTRAVPGQLPWSPYEAAVPHTTGLPNAMPRFDACDPPDCRSSTTRLAPSARS